MCDFLLQPTQGKWQWSGSVNKAFLECFVSVEQTQMVEQINSKSNDLIIQTNKPKKYQEQACPTQRPTSDRMVMLGIVQ